MTNGSPYQRTVKGKEDRTDSHGSEIARILQGYLAIMGQWRTQAATISQVRDAAILLENWRELLGSALGINGASGSDTVVRLRNGVRFEIPRLSLPDLVMSNLIFTLWDVWHEHVYTPAGFEIERDDTVLDVGANLGFFTVFAALHAPQGRVVAFEPVNEAFKYLQRNIVANRLRNTEVSMKGILDQTGEREMYVDSVNIGGHSIYRPLSVSGIQPRLAQFASLDSVLVEYGLEELGLLKMDVEGSEFPILLRTAEKWFRQIHRIALEYHTAPGRVLNQLTSRLREMGYGVTFKPYDQQRGMLWATRL